MYLMLIPIFRFNAGFGSRALGPRTDAKEARGGRAHRTAQGGCSPLLMFSAFIIFIFACHSECSCRVLNVCCCCRGGCTFVGGASRASSCPEERTCEEEESREDLYNACVTL